MEGNCADHMLRGAFVDWKNINVLLHPIRFNKAYFVQRDKLTGHVGEISAGAGL